VAINGFGVFAVAECGSQNRDVDPQSQPASAMHFASRLGRSAARIVGSTAGSLEMGVVAAQPPATLSPVN